MSRIRSLEKELDQIARQKQKRESELLAAVAAERRASRQEEGEGPGTSSGGGDDAQAALNSSQCSSSGSSGRGDGTGEAPSRGPAASTYRDALFAPSSPMSTGSRFDILLDGGGASCSKSGLRRAAAPSAQRQKPKAAPAVAAAAVAGASPSAPPISIPSTPPFRRLQRQPFSHVLVCDFEATCDSGSVNYPHEIIEFPVVALDTATLQVVAEFHAYVRPVRNPKLTAFCTELTGITQAMVDAAEPLPAVVARFSGWLEEAIYPLCRAWRATHAAVEGGAEHCRALANNLRSEQKRFVYDDRTDAAAALIPEERMVCFATDGPWDMRRFMHECGVLRDGVDFPPVCYRYINVRHSFCEHFKRRQMKLTHMLRKLNMDFEGQRHSGICDTRNIARVLAELFARGYRVHHVSIIKYAHRGDAFLAANAAARELLEEYGEDDDDNRARRNNHSNNNTSGKSKGGNGNGNGRGHKSKSSGGGGGRRGK